MNPDYESELKTAEQARGADDVRGRAEERMIRPGGHAPQPPASDPHMEYRNDSRNMASARPWEGPRTSPNGSSVLFAAAEAEQLRARWSDVQAGFVDEPRQAVERADSLVTDVTTRLTEVFARERAALEKQWGRGDEVTTEDLRIALQRYRAFLDRLLSL